MEEDLHDQDPARNPSPEIKVWVASGFIRILSLIPLPVSYLVGVVIGEPIYWLFGSRRRVTVKNLTACFPDLDKREIRRLSRHHFHHMVLSLFTMSIAWWASKQRIKRLATYHQREYFDQALEQNKNIILLAPHFTSLELLGAILLSQTHMSGMYQKHRNPSLDAEMIRRRTRFGSIVFNYKGSMKGLVRSIRDGVPFYYLPDQDPGKTRGVFAPFFGIQTATFPALSKLSRLGDAIVIPCMARVRRFGAGIDVVFDRPLENYPTSDQVADAATMNQAIEKLIENAPEQYFWSHKRFKTRPDGEPPFY